MAKTPLPGSSTAPSVEWRSPLRFPPVFEAYATIVLPLGDEAQDPEDAERQDPAMLAVHPPSCTVRGGRDPTGACCAVTGGPSALRPNGSGVGETVAVGQTVAAFAPSRNGHRNRLVGAEPVGATVCAES